MHEFRALVLALVAGGVLGAIFFGGLWWTVGRGASSRQPALWFGGSLVVRMGIALTGLYYASNRQWDTLVVCLVGFMIARLVVTLLTRPVGDSQPHRASEVGNAS